MEPGSACDGGRLVGVGGREVHLLQEGLEAGVGAEGVEDMYDLESNKETGALIVCLFKPPKCLVLLAEPDANKTRGG